MLNKYLADNKVYKERLKICNSCDRYFKPTGTCTRCGCFMRVKAKISNQSCPDKLWLKTSKLSNHRVKANMIELYNTIYQGGFNLDTNCSSCLKAVFDGIEIIHKKYIENE